MVEKQWFGCHDGWAPQFWLKIRISPAEFSTDLSIQTRLLQDLQLMDPNLYHPKSYMGCIK
jgi:hypothetical protein